MYLSSGALRCPCLIVSLGGLMGCERAVVAHPPLVPRESEPRAHLGRLRPHAAAGLAAAHAAQAELLQTKVLCQQTVVSIESFKKLYI